jgi:nucleoside diphosphate kinase
MERSLIMLKPDAFERDLVGVIEAMVYARSLSIVRKKVIFLNRWNLLELWPKIHTLWGWLASQQYHLGYQLEVWEIEGEGAISKIDELKLSLRSTYCDPNERMRKLIHTADSAEDFEREKEVLFTLPSRLEDCDDNDRRTYRVP